MKLCRFNYFLRKDEKALSTISCRMKAYIQCQIIDTEGIILITDSRLCFCNIIGDHPNLIIEFEYKYINSVKLKDKNYICFKYNGDPIKITDMNLENVQILLNFISNYTDIVINKVSI
ncbi:MAG: PH domain-containing protein [Terrisporobacter sp.]